MNATCLPLLVLATWLALGTAGCAARPGLAETGSEVATLEASGSGSTWFRGNLHAHSLWSDGDAYPEQVAAWYRDQGYAFVALSDHDEVMRGERWIDPTRQPRGAQALAALRRDAAGEVPTRDAGGTLEVRLSPFDDVARRLDSPGRFLVLRASEVSDAVSTASIHLTAVNVATPLRPLRGSSAAMTVESHLATLPRAPATLGILNHPNFHWSVTAEQMLRMPSLGLFEVYNGHPLSNNNGDPLHASTERAWDIVLAYRIAMLGQPLLYGVASDDAHDFHAGPRGDSAPGRGWVMVPGSRLSPGAIADALRGGRFYASTGVSLARVVEYDGGLRVEVAGEPDVEYRTEFVGTRRGFDAASRPARSRAGQLIYATRLYSDGIGEVLATVPGTEAEYAFHPDDLYVRARITASRRHPNPSQPGQFEQAWVQPVLGPAGRLGPALPRTGLAPPSPPGLHATLASSLQPVTTQAPLPLGRTTADCKLDLVGNAQGIANLVLTNDDSIMLGGWIADRDQPAVPLSIGVLLRGESDYVAELGNGVARPDVAAQLGQPALDGAGFNVVLPLGALRQGTYSIVLLGHYPADTLECATGFRVMIRKPVPRPTGG